MLSTASSRRQTPYYRVSIQKQGAFGLGLEVQQATVRAFVPDPAQLLAEYVEVEIGKNNYRSQLLAAIAEARRAEATPLIAKLARLSRNAGVDFVQSDEGFQKGMHVAGEKSHEKRSGNLRRPGLLNLGRRLPSGYSTTRRLVVGP